MLQKTMEKESDKLNFETAAKLRDRITSLKKTLEQQKTVTLDFTDRDVIALHRDEQGVTLVILFIRNGQLIGSKDFTLVNAPLPDGEIISSLVNQFYAEGRLIPREILIPLRPGRSRGDTRCPEGAGKAGGLSSSLPGRAKKSN